MADNPSIGGGKIRPKRAGAARKPYSRAPSQRKSLFSRVTDSFKSLLNPITPKWLVSRPEDEDEAIQSPRSIGGADPEEPSTSANHQENRTNNNYKRSPLSRPPMKSTVLKTSTTSLQYYVTPPDTPAQEEGTESANADTGKEGLLKHLTMTSKRLKLELDTPALSDSSYMRSEMKLLSTNDNASVASSSGCSSSVQVGSHRTDTSDNEPNQKPHWSSSMDSVASSRTTSSSRQQTTMTSNKRPRFNPAIFGMPSLGVNKYTEQRESSFYDGPVQFGGANASARSPYFASPYKIPSVTKVKVRHVNHQRTPARPGGPISSKSPLDESSTVGMSSTAKKILQTLEKMSSPLNDARKIPTMTRTPSSFAADRRKRRTVGGSSLLNASLQPPPAVGLASPSSVRLRRRSHMPSNNSLLVKKTQDKQKDEESIPKTKETRAPRLEVSEAPSSIRGAPAPIASMSSSASMPKVQSPLTKNEGPGGGGGKMKSQKRTSSHYSSMHEEEPEDETPNLPNVPLPVSSLPSFNFGKSMITSTPTVSRPQDKPSSSSKQPEFNFASPVIKTKELEQEQSSKSGTDNTPTFQFSSPPTKGPSVGGEQDTPKARPLSNFSSGSKPSAQSLVFAPDPKVVSAVKAAKRRSSPLATSSAETSQSGLRPSQSLKAGSVLDVLAGNSDSKSDNVSSSSTMPLKQEKTSGWTCSVCMVPNDENADSCVACTTPKPGAEQKPLLSSVFPKKKGWDCGTCMVPNDADAEKCVACQTLKPGSSADAGGLTAFSGSSIFKTGDAVPQTQKFSFGLQQKKDTQSTSDASNSLSQKFKKPEGSWECGVCLVRNAASATKCDACQTARPGCKPAAGLSNATSDSSATSKFKFGLPTASPSSTNESATGYGWGSFAKKSSPTWECEVCMVPNPEERKTCEACDSPKPGTKKELNTSFKFGESSSGLFKFGLQPEGKTTPSEKGSISIKKEDAVQSSTMTSQLTETSTATSDSVAAKPTFSFGLPTQAPALSAGTIAPVFGATTKPETSAPTFSFGQKMTSNKAETTQTTCDTITTEPTQQTFSFQQKTTSTETKLKVVSEAETKTSVFGFGAPTKTESAPEPSSKLPAFGNPSSDNPAFGTNLQSSVASPVGTSKPTFQQLPSTSGSGGFSAFGVTGPKPVEKKPLAASGFNFNAPSSGALSAAFKQSEQPVSNSTGSGQPAFSFSGAKPTITNSLVPSFGSTGTAVSTQSHFAGFGGSLQQTATSDAKKTDGLKPSLPFSQTRNSTAPPQQGGIFGSSSAAGSSPFSAPAPKPAFSLGASSSSGPFGTPGSGADTTNIFANNANKNSGFGVATGNAAQTSSSSGGIFGSNPNPAFGNVGPSDASTGSQKPLFAFGSSNNEQTKPGGFQFSGSSQPVSTGLPFGASNQQPNTSNVQFSFGATPNKGAFNPAPAAPSGGFPFGGQTNTQSNGVFQFGASNNQPNPEPGGANNQFVFGASGNSNPGGPSASTGFNFSSASASSFNFGAQPSGGQPSFTGGDPFNQQSRSTTPIQQQGRRRLQARRKIRK